MKTLPGFITLLAIFLAASSTTLIGISDARSPASSEFASEQSDFEKREAAYRASNIGVALLEQYKAREAVDSFRRALEIKPDLPLARINLAIALYYLPDAEGAKHEAEKALTLKPDAPQPHYILGLIARAQNRFDDAQAAFQKVLQIDPDDVGANVNSGQILVQQKRHAEAVAAFRRAFAAEPYNETALYNLGLLLTRSGERAEGQQLLQKFQQLKQSGAGTTIGNNYLEGGRYAEAIVSTGAEAGLVDKVAPDVSFADATESVLPPAQERGGQLRPYLGSAIVLLDFDNDGDLDLFGVFVSQQKLYRNDRGKFADVTAQSGLRLVDHIWAHAVAGDYDNDDRHDLLLSGMSGLMLYRNMGSGKFQNVTTMARVPAYPYSSGATAFVDIDHDGDLDIFVAGGSEVKKAGTPVPTGAPKESVGKFPPAPNLLLRNNGDGTFADVTAAAKLNMNTGHAVAVVPTDFDNRRDIDLLVASEDGSVELWKNLRDGTFRNVAAEVGLDAKGGPVGSVAAGDVNKDGFTDFYFGRANGPGEFALSAGKGRFRIDRAPASTPQTTAHVAAQFLDYDNDGLLDLLTVSQRGKDVGGLRVLRNTGDGWADVSEKAAQSLSFGKQERMALLGWLACGDVDGDGDIDLVGVSTLNRFGFVFARNDGGNGNRSARVDLKARVSNRSAVQAKVEMRAGSLYQKLETYSASPAPAPADLIFGLGKRERPDAIRVLWPAGIVQAETEFPASSSNRFKLGITELDRKPSSCPYLYAWNGKRFEFVTDFMGGGEMGYLKAPGHYNKPDADEYVRITADQLKEKDGRYELRVTNELEEALFVDRLQLLAVAHPTGTEVYPNEGMTAAPKPFKLFVVQNARPPLSAKDDHGHDVLDLISRIDRRWPADFKVDRIRGYAEDHALTLNFAEPPKVQRPESKVLLLTGWTDYAWSSDNVAATQAGKAMKPPALQVKDRSGNWRTVIEDIGIPVGRPQTVTVDLTGKFVSDNREVRIVTNMRIYWDQILVSESDETSPGQIVKLDPIGADLRWRGYSAEVTPDGREPFGYDYQRVSFISPWKVMTGRYTREGDVRELLLNTDDMFVICRTGDEISLSFDALRLPPLPAGWTRTFLLYSDGFSKEMDINSASPDQVGPLPFHGMSRYPYKWPERYPLTEARRNYLEKYNTRVVTAPVLRLSGSSTIFQVSSWSTGSK